MSIIRIKKEQKYFVAANAPFQDKNLSWEARGAMGYLLSKPDGWQCRNYDLVNQGPAGEHTIKRIMKELRENGYVHRFKVSQGRSKIEWVTEIYESPDLNPNFTTGDFTTVVNTTGDTIEVVKSADIVSTDSQKVLITESTDSNGSAKNPLKANDLNTLADQMAKVCQIDISTAGPKVRTGLKKMTLILSRKPNVIQKLENFPAWWAANDWRGKKGQPPTPAQVGDTWGQFEAAQTATPNGVANTGPTLTEAEKKRLAELTAQFDPK